MLETNIRQIAIQAIAARASGSPVEAAGQILAGIAALDSPGKPFVIWPTNLSPAEQIKALESELERIRHITQSMADYWATRDSHPQADSGARPEHQDTQRHKDVPDVHAAEIVAGELQSRPEKVKARFTQSSIVQVSIAGRCSPTSTEIIPSIVGMTLPEFWLDLWGEVGGERLKLGYVKFELATTSVTEELAEGTYQLAQLLPADAQPPHPIVSMSGVLWPRQRVLADLEQGDSSLLAAYHFQGLSFLGDRGGCPRES